MLLGFTFPTRCLNTHTESKTWKPPFFINDTMIFNRDENGEWRRLYNEELHSLYHSPNIVRVIKYRRLRWAGHVVRMEKSRSAFKILTGKPTGKRPLRRPRRRWEDSIRMDLEEIGINAGNWVDSAQDRDYWRALVNAALRFHKPWS